MDEIQKNEPGMTSFDYSRLGPIPEGNVRAADEVPDIAPATLDFSGMSASSFNFTGN
jgi:hypothetical protein